MELDLFRDKPLPHATTGILSIDSTFECFICEDQVRPVGEAKVPGKTAIGTGRFEVVITWSNRFKRRLPLLLHVPDFEGVRIHPGNSAIDTDGCLLTGQHRDEAAGTVQQSVLAFDALFAKLDAALQTGKVFITIH